MVDNRSRTRTRKRCAGELLLAGLWAVVAMWGLVPEAVAAPQTHTVTIEGMRFLPATLTVRHGDRIVWVNKDLVSHTVTNKFFDSHNVAPNASWTYVARKPGQYPYGCALHPTMTATLIVQ